MNGFAIYFALLFALGYGAIAYRSVASARAWPIGGWFDADFSPIKLLGYAAMASAVLLALAFGPWWIVFPVLLMGYATSFSLTMVLKRKFQWFCAAALPATFAFGIFVCYQNA